MKPVYLKNTETRLAGAERKIRFLERRSQLPEDHPDYDPGTGGGGIQFDTHPQDGDWLFVETTGDRGTGGVGIELLASEQIVLTSGTAMLLSGEGIELTSTVSLLFTAPDFQFLGADPGTDFSVSVTGGVTLGGGSNSVTITPASGISVISNVGPLLLYGSTIGFFSSGGVAQPAHPTTLAHVITALTDLGLTA